MKQIKQFLIGAAFIALCVSASSCSNAFNDATGATSSSGGPPSVKQGPVTETGGDFVAVTGITGVPAVAYAGTTRPLSGTVIPANATNQSIVWSLTNDGGTGAVLENNTLKDFTVAGTVTVRATVANGAAQGTAYTEDFDINVYGRPQFGHGNQFSSPTYKFLTEFIHALKVLDSFSNKMKGKNLKIDSRASSAYNWTP